MLFSLAASAQNLFLPSVLNTPRGDIPWSFTEYNGSYYFAGTQGYTPAGQRDSLSGFCFKTDKQGQIQQRFDLREVAQEPFVSFEAIGVHNNEVHIIGLTGYFFFPYNKVVMNKFLHVVLDTNLVILSLDTFQYDALTSDVGFLKVVYNDEGIYLGSATTPDNGYPYNNSFLTRFSYNGTVGRHQPLTSAFLNGSTQTDSTMLFALTKAQNERVFLSAISRRNFTSTVGWDIGSAFLIDSNFQLVDSLIDIPNIPHTPYTRNIAGFYHDVWETAPGRYYAGSLVMEDFQRTTLGIGKMSVAKNSIRYTLTLPALDSMDIRDHSQAFKQPMLPLSDQRRIALLGMSYRSQNYQQYPNDIRVAMFDTSLNLLWQRGFGKAGHSFIGLGIHELSSSGLMVLAAGYDYGSGGNGLYEFYCFVLDSTGTPLFTFTIPNLSQNTVTLYPNPATEEIRFGLPNSSAKAEYMLTDMQGKVLRSGMYNSGEALSISTFPPALYGYKIRTADGVWHSGLFTKQ